MRLQIFRSDAITVFPTATSIFESYASCLDPVYVRKTSFCKPNTDTNMPFCSSLGFIFTCPSWCKSPVRPATRVVPLFSALSQRGSATKFHVTKRQIYLRICGIEQISSKTTPCGWGRATAPLRRGSLALPARAVTMVMAARSDVPAKSETFPGGSSICVFLTRTPVYSSFVILNFSEWGKPECGPQARLVVLLSCDGHSKKSIDSISTPPGRTLLSRHRHGTKTRNHHNFAELIFPHCTGSGTWMLFAG
jgi:hypothetical protein